MSVYDFELDIDTVCSLLGSEYRRQTLRCLDRTGGTTLGGLTRQLRQGMGVEEPRDTIEVCLYHKHLPKLAEYDVIEWDTRTNTVSLTAKGEQLLTYLDELER